MGARRTGGPDSGAARFSAMVQSPAAEPKRTAVLVDRDEPTRAALARTLSADGVQVAGESADPALAAALIRERRPDVVVLGITDAPEDLAVLIELTGERIAPVIVLTDELGAAQIAAVRDAGAHGLLPAFPSRAALVPAVELAVARFAETARLSAEVEAAARRLESRKLIDRAKGLLMTHRGLSEPEAFRWIQRTAMDRRKSSSSVAAQVIAEFDRESVRAAS